MDTVFVDCKMEADSGANIMDCVLDPQSEMSQNIKTEVDFTDENIDLIELKKEITDEITDEITQDENFSSFTSSFDLEWPYFCRGFRRL